MNMDDWKKELDRKAHDFAETFSTEHGKKVMEAMEQAFQTDLFNDNSLTMAKNVGQYELLQYMKILVKRGKTNANK